MKNQDFNRIKEKFLLDLLDETKRLIVAQNVIKEQKIHKYVELLKPENQRFAKNAGDILYEETAASLLTALMIVLGYRIPKSDLYRLVDFGDLCSWLGETYEDGQQKWEDG